MNLLTLENVSKSFTERMLFDHISLGINEGDKIGVIGINGTGKSTLLKIIAGLEEPDEGTVTKGNKLRIAYLPQTPVFDDTKSILANVTEGQSAKESYRNLAGEARSMLLKFGITDPEGSASVLSGGQKKRAALVRTLLTESDLLVLDEPTNHLDSDMTEWLEDYLNKWKGAFIMITHDRYFLDRVTNKIVELDKGKLYSYQTNYSGFIALKAEREEMALATERKARTLFKTELAWMQRGARARSTKQKAHIQRFEALRDREKIREDGSVEINALSSRMGKKTIELYDISKSYNGRLLFAPFSYILLSTDRIGIVGHNGCGKSTLLNILTGNLLPDTGYVEMGTTMKIGYFSQENEALNPDQTVLQYVRDTAEYIETKDGTMSASAMCEQFLFDGSMQHTRIEKLSGGEKRRLYLLKVLMEAPNVLILDEPTNDLDIQTLTILENYLQDYPGIVVTVSHDRYFLDKTATRIFSFEHGTIARYEGNYSDFKEAQKERGTIPASSVPGKPVQNSSDGTGADNSNTSKATWKQREAKLKFSYKEQKEYETIDADIAALEEKIAGLEQDIAGAATEYSRLTALMAEKEQAEAALDEKMDRWVYLNDLAEQIEAAKNV
ncbi:MAG: ABC-F family ATP-binding cassette domain-containing protein [Lachnospiraceae bacterium]|nr:ABC-F family ATP-binding cassette domain-containing protein [Lachnospiraceae bacterium]